MKNFYITDTSFMDLTLYNHFLEAAFKQLECFSEEAAEEVVSDWNALAESGAEPTEWETFGEGKIWVARPSLDLIQFFRKYGVEVEHG